MKTRKQKVICRVLCMVVSIFLLASFFVVPVAALDQLTTVVIDNIIYDYGSDPNDPDQRPFVSFYLYESSLNLLNNSVLNSFTSSTDRYKVFPSGILTDDSYMGFGYLDLDPSLNHFGVYYINNFFDDGVQRTFAKGDTVFIEGSNFPIFLFYDNRLIKYRFTLRNDGDPYSFDFGPVVASTDLISINVTEDDYGFDYDRLSFKFDNPVTSSSLCLCLEVQFDIDPSELYFEIEEASFTFKFGSGVSPNYPIYPAAPGGNDVGNYGSAEQELIQSQEQGLSQGANSMQSAGSNLQSLSSDLKLMSFVPVLSGALDKIATIPGVMPLVNISLSLGLFASLMGLGASIVSAAERRAGQANSKLNAKLSQNSKRRST